MRRRGRFAAMGSGAFCGRGREYSDCYGFCNVSGPCRLRIALSAKRGMGLVHSFRCRGRICRGRGGYGSEFRMGGRGFSRTRVCGARRRSKLLALRSMTNEGPSSVLCNCPGVAPVKLAVPFRGIRRRCEVGVFRSVAGSESTSVPV